MISTNPWIWLSAFLSLACFSLFLGDNKAFRWAETTYTASVIGHSTVTGLLVMRDRFYPLYTGAKPILIIPLILGITVLLVVWRKYAWISSIALAVLVGVGTGMSLRTLTSSDIIANTRAVVGEATKIIRGPLTTQVGSIINIIFTISALFYFLFTLFPRGTLSKPLNYLRTLGKYALITYMGISVGNTIQQWVGTATSALYRLIVLWLGLR